MTNSERRSLVFVFNLQRVFINYLLYEGKTSPKHSFQHVWYFVQLPLQSLITPLFSLFSANILSFSVFSPLESTDVCAYRSMLVFSQIVSQPSNSAEGLRRRFLPLLSFRELFRESFLSFTSIRTSISFSSPITISCISPLKHTLNSFSTVLFAGKLSKVLFFVFQFLDFLY